ncbi:GRB2-associated-binding protein 1-like isoform X1 [Stylophora pistillata]|uniref:GRB2-associated-binding protein 1-like isoform X1 n=1 Tax=Stylophora pistillata TaxID=50429 RepID=UPI000C04973F|nr:GRB2-associated-binding protein 1-like isoform X1 [Stylophora pistillata]
MTKMDDEDIMISGYLRKSPPENKFKVSSRAISLQLKFWQKRFFVLHKNGKLRYYKSDKEKRPIKDALNLVNCKSVESHLANTKFKNVFSIAMETRTYYLVADTQEDMENWVAKICNVCGFSRTDDDNQVVNSPQKGNTPQPSPIHSQPIAARLRPTSPIGSPSSISSSSSSVTSPTGPCPLSIPKHIIDERKKSRSNSDPPDPSPVLQVYHDKQRRQSEQIGSLTCPVNVHGVLSGRHSPSGVSPRQDMATIGGPSETYDVVPTPRYVSQEPYDILPSPQRVPRTPGTEENYDDVPIPRPFNFPTHSSSPRVKSTGRLLSPSRDDYDAVPLPRPVSQASNRSSQDIYDMVPPPRPASSCSETQDDQGLYDIPPTLRSPEKENYDFVPPPRRASAADEQDGQSLYDIPPIIKMHEQENYDVVPIPKPIAKKNTHVSQGLYRAQESENYDIVPQPRPVSTGSDMQDGQDIYDVPPSGRILEQSNYDTPPPVHRRRQAQQDASKENYDVVPLPRPTSQDVYDVVPPARPAHARSLPRDENNHDPRFSDSYCRPSSEDVSDVYNWVPPPVPSPYQSKNVDYDTLPKTNRPVSADSGLNASFSSICSLKLENQDEKYDAPLPPVPKDRDSGSLSDETPDCDPNLEDIYDRPPNLASRDSIYDVPPKQEDIYDVLPRHPTEVYDVPPTSTDDIYDVPPPAIPNQAGNTVAPAVDRTLKRPPQVNRAIKPKTQTSQDHSYCNMAPPVDRQSKYKKNTMPQPEHSYINYRSQPRPQNLPLVRVLNSNPLVGSLPNQPNKYQRQSECAIDDLEYCEMTPTRSQWTRCYSLDKDGTSQPHGNNQFYEDMTSIQSRRFSGAKSSSSSSSSLAENDDIYTAMSPGHASSSSPMSMEQRKRRDLLYAEVEIVDNPHLKPQAAAVIKKSSNTHYTYINEESTRALLETSNARREKSLIGHM